MARESRVRARLYQMAARWEQEKGRGGGEGYPYVSVLKELLFHADLRFGDYVQYRFEDPFPVRLDKWLGNVSLDRERRTLFTLLPWILFLDRQQMLSLYRHAYRRIVAAWLLKGTLDLEQALAPDYELKVRLCLRRYRLYSVTESFSIPDFLHINNLSGLPKPQILGPRRAWVKTRLPDSYEGVDGLIILEDFVGTGTQVSGVLGQVARYVPNGKRLLFVPLIILESGFNRLREAEELQRLAIEPVLVIPRQYCVGGKKVAGEPVEFERIRKVVESTASRVVEPYDALDDPPSSAYGYGDSGASVVTCHNVPNNSLPLIHHRSPQWYPLFRRVHAAGGRKP